MKLLATSAAVAAVIASFGLAPDADAAIIDYVEIGVSQVEANVSGVEFDEGRTLNFALGGDLGPFRAEAGYSNAAVSGAAGVIQGDADVFHATLFLDAKTSERTSLYIGAGIDYIDGEATVFGSQIGSVSGRDWHYAAGGAVRVTDNIILEAEYRHIQDLDADTIGLNLRFAL